MCFAEQRRALEVALTLGRYRLAAPVAAGWRRPLIGMDHAGWPCRTARQPTGNGSLCGAEQRADTPAARHPGLLQPAQAALQGFNEACRSELDIARLLERLSSGAALFEALLQLFSSSLRHKTSPTTPKGRASLQQKGFRLCWAPPAANTDVAREPMRHAQLLILVALAAAARAVTVSTWPEIIEALDQSTPDLEFEVSLEPAAWQFTVHITWQFAVGHVMLLKMCRATSTPQRRRCSSLQWQSSTRH